MERTENKEVHPKRETVVLSNELIAPGVYSLRFPRTFDFEPGQVIALTSSTEIAARYYSIASGCTEEEIEILYDLVPDGSLTPVLSSLSGGERLLVSEPFGSFIDRGKSTWWVATGTGVAPFLAMVRSGLGKGRTLVHGGRTLDRFYYHDYLADRLDERYTCCCSSETAAWVYPGRLTAWLRAQSGVPGSAHFMLCGGAGMVVEVRDLLIEKGVPFENITAEIYF